METRYLRSDDGHRIFIRIWKNENPVATVHINHGMAEHSQRYSLFAEYLVSLGFSVYAQDHRGHGYTKEDGETGWFAESNGWRRVVSDAILVDSLITEENPGIPHFVFGHSMGSFVTRICLNLNSSAYDGACICGTGASQGIVGRIGLHLARKRAAKYGSKAEDRLLDSLAFGNYTKHFPKEGKIAWLTKDKEERKKYEEDPLCGFLCTSSFYADLITLSFAANDPEACLSIRKDLPLMLISGDQDPVGDYGKGVEKVWRMYRQAGIENVALQLFKNDRHELLNETDKEDVMKCISDFFLGIMERQRTFK